MAEHADQLFQHKVIGSLDKIAISLADIARSLERLTRMAHTAVDLWDASRTGPDPDEPIWPTSEEEPTPS